MGMIREKSKEELIEEIRGLNARIAELERLEKKGKESERMLEYAQRIAHLGNWTWEIDRDNFYGSRETYDIFEIPPGTPINYSELMDRVHPDDRLMLQGAIEDGLKGAKYNVEFRIISGKGRMKYVQGIAELTRMENGENTLSGTIQDITDKKEQENEQKRLIEKLKEALGRIKTLSGLIPICANCKRIRDDKGYWLKLEKYVEEHSRAEFTHSLCPECEEKLYGKDKERKG